VSVNTLVLQMFRVRNCEGGIQWRRAGSVYCNPGHLRPSWTSTGSPPFAWNPQCCGHV